MNPHSLGIISAALVIAIVVGLVIDPTWNRYWEIVCIAMLVVGIVGMLTTPPVAMVVEVWGRVAFYIGPTILQDVTQCLSSKQSQT